MDDEWGLTEKGFYRPTYTVLLNALEYKARELYGDGIILTVRSPLGLFLRILAWVWNILFACLEDVYNSRFVETSVGNSLYNLGKNIGMHLLTEGKASGYITVTGTSGSTIPAGFLVATNGGLQYTVVDAITLSESGTGLALIRAVETGPEYNTAAGTVRVIVNPSSVNGVESITNKAEISGGRIKETDAEFRARYNKSVDYAGGVNADAVRAALMNDVEGVSSAYVYENDTDESDTIYNLPPHSLEAVVYGGLDEEIAKAIYSRKAGGIQTVGNKAVNVLTASGQQLEVRFSRPTTKKIYVKVTELQTGEGFPGEDKVRQALIDYIGGTTVGGLETGMDVIYIKIPGILTAIPGVEDFELQIGTSMTSYAKENIAIGYREKAITDSTAISITMKGG